MLHKYIYLLKYILSIMAISFRSTKACKVLTHFSFTLLSSLNSVVTKCVSWVFLEGKQNLKGLYKVNKLEQKPTLVNNGCYKRIMNSISHSTKTRPCMQLRLSIDTLLQTKIWILQREQSCRKSYPQGLFIFSKHLRLIKVIFCVL